MLKRDVIVRRYNPKLKSVNVHSPLTVGNGDFAFTADVTGLQTLWDEYEKTSPLVTMSDFSWHTRPLNGHTYTLNDLDFTKYKTGNKEYAYPVNPENGQEEIYDWLRQNPHRFNLMRVFFIYDGKEIRSDEITSIDQELDLYTGVLNSSFVLNGETVAVETVVGESDTLGIRAESVLFRSGLKIGIEFPYGSPDMSASDFASKESHKTQFVFRGKNEVRADRQLDNDSYYVYVTSSAKLAEADIHRLETEQLKETDRQIEMTVACLRRKASAEPVGYKRVHDDSVKRFYTFWNSGAFLDVSESEDSRADELERRIVTSMYLTYIQCTGTLPPQETGLSCNSWYGKFHLEMHPLHAAYLALYGHGRLLEKSFEWYKAILPKARENAGRNGYKGARWPKMVGPEGTDSPSVIAPLLIWQQPHLIYMIELLRSSRYDDYRVEVPEDESETEFLNKYKDLILDTAEFMADFAIYNEDKGIYELFPPIIPVQENHKPIDTVDPAFETAYWKFGLKTAYKLLKKISIVKEDYLDISNKMAPITVFDGKVAAHKNCKTTYTEYNKDHPSMLFAYGMLSEDIDEEILNASFEAVMKNWDKKSLWGWDFAMLAMVLAKHGRMEEAFDILLMNTEKNTYVESGNNAQLSRSDLPLYLPGNGSLLLAMTLLTSCNGWYVEKEGMMKYPY